MCRLDESEALWHYNQLLSMFRTMKTGIDAGFVQQGNKAKIGDWYEIVCTLQMVLGLERVKYLKFQLLKYYIELPDE